MKVDTEYDEVYSVQYSAEEIRAWFDGEALDDLDTALDNAQGYVKTHKEKCYVVVEVKP